MIYSVLNQIFHILFLPLICGSVNAVQVSKGPRADVRQWAHAQMCAGSLRRCRPKSLLFSRVSKVLMKRDTIKKIMSLVSYVQSRVLLHNLVVLCVLVCGFGHYGSSRTSTPLYRCHIISNTMLTL